MEVSMKKLLSAALAVMLLFLLCVPGYAAVASERGLTLSKSTYIKDGNFCVKLTLTTGSLPYGSNRKTKMDIELYNSAGKKVISWDQKSYSPNTTITREPSIQLSGFTSGTYTMRVTCALYGEEWVYNGYSAMPEERYQWNFTINHTQPSTVNLSKVETVYRDDGSYANKFVFSHSEAKGQVLNMELYDQWGSRVYSVKGSSPIAYTSGTYSFQWGGYPSGGGPQCDSGEYTVKYWLDGKNAKQAKYWLNIY
jgi:hypothetical protein